MTNKIHTLIIVPGHASFTKNVSLPLPDKLTNDSYWALQPFQRGEPPFYIEHIKQALELVDDSSLLMFSGGRTRSESGRTWSEAKTYDEIAKNLPLYPLGQVELEEYARDSYQNLDNSIRKFEHLFGYKPQFIYVVGWIFKEARFRFHAETLQLPGPGFKYIGVNNPSSESLAGALIGEQKTLRNFIENPDGSSGILAAKRLERDPWNDGAPRDY